VLILGKKPDGAGDVGLARGKNGVVGTEGKVAWCEGTSGWLGSKV
jgi:hypothetical protein